MSPPTEDRTAVIPSDNSIVPISCELEPVYDLGWGDPDAIELMGADMSDTVDKQLATRTEVINLTVSINQDRTAGIPAHNSILPVSYQLELAYDLGWEDPDVIELTGHDMSDTNDKELATPTKVIDLTVAQPLVSVSLSEFAFADYSGQQKVSRIFYKPACLFFSRIIASRQLVTTCVSDNSGWFRTSTDEYKQMTTCIPLS